MNAAMYLNEYSVEDLISICEPIEIENASIENQTLSIQENQLSRIYFSSSESLIENS